MLESGFFAPKNGDRKYSVENLNEILDGIVSDGIIPGIGDEFEVTVNDSNVVIGTGRALFDNIWIKNTEPIEIGISTVMTKRYDAVAIKIDKSDNTRATTILIIEESESDSPEKIVMQNTDKIFYHVLAYCLVEGNTVTVEDARVFAKNLLSISNNSSIEKQIQQSYFCGLYPAGDPIINLSSEYGILNECLYDGGILFLLRGTQYLYYLDKNCNMKCITTSAHQYISPICQFGNGVMFHHINAGYLRYELFNDNGILYSPTDNTITVLPSGATNYVMHDAWWDAENNQTTYVCTYTAGSQNYISVKSIHYPDALLQTNKTFSINLATPYVSAAITDGYALAVSVLQRSGTSAVDIAPYLVNTKNNSYDALSLIHPNMDSYSNFKTRTFWSNQLQAFLIVYVLPYTAPYNQCHIAIIDPQTKTIRMKAFLDSYSYGYTIGEPAFDDASNDIFYSCYKSTSGVYTYRLIKINLTTGSSLVSIPVEFQSLAIQQYTNKYIHQSLVPIATGDSEYLRLLYDHKNGIILIPYTPKDLPHMSLFLGENVAIATGYNSETHKTRGVYPYELDKRLVLGGVSVNVQTKSTEWH